MPKAMPVRLWIKTSKQLFILRQIQVKESIKWKQLFILRQIQVIDFYYFKAAIYSMTDSGNKINYI